ncbi:MAG: 2'-5' RNA ligase family protein, partial [Pseudomonadota bacterium]
CLEALHETLEAKPLPRATLTPLAYALLGSGRPRAVVLDIAADPGLTALREMVRRAAQGAGIPLARERFRPHITLLRFSASAPPDAGRLPTALTRLGTPAMAPEVASGVTLWSSTLTPDGPLYDPLATYRLAA